MLSNQLLTNRLILRTWQERDLVPFAKINEDPKVMEFFPNTLTEAESNALVKKIQAHFSKYGYGLWAVELRSSKEFIGFVGLNTVDFDTHFTPAVEIGWRIASEYWGQGYATEAAKAVVKKAFNDLDLIKLVSFASQQNYRSIHVMQKLSMTHNLQDDFGNPRLPSNHPLYFHVLYQLNKEG